MLTAEQVDRYRANGFLVVPDLLPRELVVELGRVTARLVAEAAELEAGNEFYDLEPSHRPGVAPRVRRLKNPNGQHALFDEVARHPAIIDAIEALHGRKGVRFTHHKGKVNIKAAEYGSAVEWHQDWSGYPHTNDDLLSVSVPLDDSALENGPLLCIPGSHKGPIYDHHVDGFFRGAMDPARDGIEFSRAVPMLGSIGMVYFHHARVVHGSALNRSNRDRRLFINQYAAVDAWPLMGVRDLDAYNRDIIRGEPTLTPRMKDVPVRIPLPVAPEFMNGLYASQEGLKSRYFETFEGNPAPATVPGSAMSSEEALRHIAGR